ncbi:MAG: peptide-methionine (R)-S-oxide reductase MsrB [Candidatus Binatia bacterium]
MGAAGASAECPTGAVALRAETRSNEWYLTGRRTLKPQEVTTKRGIVVAMALLVALMQAGAAGLACAWEASSFQKPSDAALRQALTPLQYEVTQQQDTEPAFRNAYWNNHQAGIYVDVVSGEPLFSSLDKYDSGTGWPSFTKPLVPANLRTKSDRSFFTQRTEVRSAHADSHLGHVFHDGPPPSGLRYCMNSAALRFIPVDKLQDEGYGEYLSLFGKAPAAAN